MNIKSYLDKFDDFYFEIKIINFYTYRDFEKAFFLACMYEKNIEIIKTIVEENINLNDSCYCNAFLYACEYNTNLNVIKFLVSDLKMEFNCENDNEENGFLVACKNNSNVNIIKYLVNVLKFNILCTNKYNVNGFLLACSYNKSVEVVKYLINDLHLNTIKQNNYIERGIIEAIDYENNIEIIKFLIEEFEINFDNDEFRFSIIFQNSLTKLSREIILYLIEIVRFNMCHFSLYCLLNKIFHVTNYRFYLNTPFLNNVKNKKYKKIITKLKLLDINFIIFH